MPDTRLQDVTVELCFDDVPRSQKSTICEGASSPTRVLNLQSVIRPSSCKWKCRSLASPQGQRIYKFVFYGLALCTTASTKSQPKNRPNHDPSVVSACFFGFFRFASLAFFTMSPPCAAGATALALAMTSAVAAATFCLD